MTTIERRSIACCGQSITILELAVVYLVNDQKVINVWTDSFGGVI